MRKVMLGTFAAMFGAACLAGAMPIGDGGGSSTPTTVRPPAKCPPPPLGRQEKEIEQREKKALKTLQDSPGYKKESPAKREEERKALQASFKALRDAAKDRHEQAEKLCRKTANPPTVNAGAGSSEPATGSGSGTSAGGSGAPGSCSTRSCTSVNGETCCYNDCTGEFVSGSQRCPR